MRGFLAVARREIEEKWFVFPAALVASLVPFAIPLMRGMHGAAAAEVREWSALVGAFTFAGGLAAALGATTIAGELAARRIGFYFSRPISGLALWAGNLGAACFMALSVAVLVSAPTLIAAKGRVVLWDHQAQALGLLVMGVFAVILVFHAGAIALRPRTPLLALDAVALVLVGLGVVALYQRFMMASAAEALWRAEIALIVAAAAALVAAGLLAVTRGRTDSRAAHRVLSVTLWGTLSAAVTLVALYAVWVFSAGPRDLEWLSAALPATRGNWVMVQGPARGAEPAFLFDVATGRSQRAGADWRWPVLSPDGTQAVWFQLSGSKGPFETMTWKLSDPSAKPVRTVLSFPGTPTAFLSEHGERLATIAGGILSIHDLASGTSLGSARVGGERTYPRGFFLSRDRFRVFRNSSPETPSAGGRLDILEFDTLTKTLATTGTIEDVDGIAYSTSDSGDRLLVRERNRIVLRDGRSGELLVSLLERGPTKHAVGRFLSDGRIAISVADVRSPALSQQPGEPLRVELFAPNGKRERTIEIPAHGRIALGGEIAPGRLVVAAGGATNETLSRTIFLVDVLSGEVRQVADGLFPVAYFAPWSSNRPNYLLAPGSEATKLFYGPGRCLVRFDPLTGERRVLLGKC
jgi:hypothetical protein